MMTGSKIQTRRMVLPSPLDTEDAAPRHWSMVLQHQPRSCHRMHGAPSQHPACPSTSTSSSLLDHLDVPSLLLVLLLGRLVAFAVKDGSTVVVKLLRDQHK